MIQWVPRKQVNMSSIAHMLSHCQETNQYTNNGPNVQLLEKEIRTALNIFDSKAIICVSNGTHALWAAIAAFELYMNKELTFTTQSFTFPASAQGYLKNVEIADIDEKGGLDITNVTTDGVVVTNIFGNVTDIDTYVKWASEKSKFLVFDNAATPFTFYNGVNSCNYGNAATISFHHTKPIGFGEGGCIIIDRKFEPCVRRIINFGFEPIPNPVWNRLGSNYKMSDIQAIFILQYLSTFQDIVEKHKSLTTYFMSMTSCKLYPNYSSDVPFLPCFCILTDNSTEKLQLLLSNNIYARKYYIPLKNTPIANSIYSNIICIPCTIDMTYRDIDRIIKLIQ